MLRARWRETLDHKNIRDYMSREQTKPFLQKNGYKMNQDVRTKERTVLRQTIKQKKVKHQWSKLYISSKYNRVRDINQNLERQDTTMKKS